MGVVVDDDDAVGIRMVSVDCYIVMLMKDGKIEDV